MSGVSGLRLRRRREFLNYEEGEDTAGACSTLLSTPDAPEGMVTAVVATRCGFDSVRRSGCMPLIALLPYLDSWRPSKSATSGIRDRAGLLSRSSSFLHPKT